MIHKQLFSFFSFFNFSRESHVGFFFFFLYISVNEIYIKKRQKGCTKVPTTRRIPCSWNHVFEFLRQIGHLDGWIVFALIIRQMGYHFTGILSLHSCRNEDG